MGNGALVNGEDILDSHERSRTMLRNARRSHGRVKNLIYALAVDFDLFVLFIIYYIIYDGCETSEYCCRVSKNIRTNTFVRVISALRRVNNYRFYG